MTEDKPDFDFVKTFEFTTVMQFDYGLIGHCEIRERWETLAWLIGNDDTDPRQGGEDEESGKQNSGAHTDGDVSEPKVEVPRNADGEMIHFIPLGLLKKWVFTIGDEDCHPSVPHGHLGAKTRPWPKLNPYIGCAFKSARTEDSTLRLSKYEMLILWRNPDFREHCRKQVMWYCEEFPHHRFQVPFHRRFRFPRW